MMQDAGWKMSYCTGKCTGVSIELKTPMPGEIIDEVIKTPGYGSTLRVAAVIASSSKYPGELTMKHDLPMGIYEYEIAWGVDTSDYSFIPGAIGSALETNCKLYVSTDIETKEFKATLFDLAGGDLPHVTRGVYEASTFAEISFLEEGHGGCYMSYVLLRGAPSEDYSTFFIEGGPSATNSYELDLGVLEQNGLVANGDVFRVRATVTNDAGLNTSIETGPLVLDWTAPVHRPLAASGSVRVHAGDDERVAVDDGRHHAVPLRPAGHDRLERRRVGPRTPEVVASPGRR